MNLSLEYRKYKEDLLSSGSSRRTKDELRIASINALLAGLDYLVAPFEDFYSAEPPEFDMKVLDQIAEDLAVRSLIDSKRLTERPEQVPDVPTLESTRRSVITRLAEEGIHRPIHPARSFGLDRESIPTDEELLRWAVDWTHASSSLTKKVLARKSIHREATKLAQRIGTELPLLVAQWEKDKTSYERRVNEEVAKEQSQLIEQRDSQIAMLAPILEMIHELKSEIKSIQQSSIAMIEDAQRLFKEGDPAITTIVLQAVMSDNAGSAAPIGIDEGDLLVVMTAPAISEVIWPEKAEIKTSMTVSKKNKTEMLTDYTIYLLAHTVATAFEAFAASPKVNQVRVLVLDQDENKVFFERRLVGVLDINRNIYDAIPKNWLMSPSAKVAVGVANRWQEALATGNPDYILQVATWFEGGSISSMTGFMRQILEMLSLPAERFITYLDKPKSKRPRLIDLTESNVNTSDSIQITVSEESDIVKSLDLPIEILGTPDFWIFCLLLGQLWDQDEVNLEKIKAEASELASVLYPSD